ncbi:hypothetical protein SAV14893_094060 [Streptomyces avermitilis]|uniref:Uncharacterized protein n=1 Tax=Streptomyces avermitilis TaxID=33903 RepID=A0A4D4NA02_STRAX|nr:hypothetical protein SAVMC3_02370 [Streptomyces avermitilis]GDY70013.1 hypothetical protein SAV14893_094060 [Streptomyces avermitilis]GDY80285.1 hypothetical protein SAV31267_097700 [Streptomyces avermitilis]
MAIEAVADRARYKHNVLYPAPSRCVPFFRSLLAGTLRQDTASVTGLPPPCLPRVRETNSVG